MSNSQSEDHGALIQTPTQLVVVVVLAFVLPIAIIFTIIHFVMGGYNAVHSANTPAEVIAARIKPVGSTPDISKEPSPLLPPEVAVAAPGGAPGGAAPAGAIDGKAIVAGTCQACHASGLMGAPKIGDKAAWAPRLAQDGGVNGLVDVATKGKGAMPPKGGNPGLTPEQLKAAIEYMTSQ